MKLVEHHGTFYVVGKGVLAELSIKTKDDFERWRVSYESAPTPDEQYRIAASIVTRCFSTANPGVDVPVPRGRDVQSHRADRP